MKKTFCILFTAFLGIAAAAFAQETPATAPATPPANPISTSEKGVYGYISSMVVAAAEKMPEENYSFKPTPDVRSFGQLIAHVADTHMMFCGLAKHDTAAKKPDFEKTATTKEAAQKALADSIAYCDAVYASTTDANMTEPVQMFGQKLTRFAALDINVGHDNEHYGNIVTYLRLKKLVPPSSEKK